MNDQMLNNVNEVWLPVKGYEGRYEVSNLGQVRSLNYNKTGNCKILKGDRQPLGYIRITLSKDGITNRCFIHRLVAETFIPNPDNLPIINHKDENPSNNSVDNLEWCTFSYNNTYNQKAVKQGVKISKARINNPKICKRILCVETGIVYPSFMEINRQLGLSTGALCDVCNGKHYTTGGYHWKYIDNNNELKIK